ncbi:hypothetical protein H6P81_002397 [Aristolochia fimbriata]|uniref:MADS-box domain-containing protein n=1 Tax=Aristolochia fimbriata TaxID=158543 RepID=A0AAV7FA78_ARIFI|nr:hypothetical protein H6P81_002397 [Aristolochia fimbriata]
MKLIDEKSRRNVAFTKRRQGLFKKAAELSTLTGAKVALLVVSPAGRAYTFGDQTLLKQQQSGQLVLPEGPLLAIEAAPENGPTTTSTSTLTVDDHHNDDQEAAPSSSISEIGDCYDLPPLPEDWSIQEFLDSLLRFSETVAQSDVDEALRLMQMSKFSLYSDDCQKSGLDAISDIYSILRDEAARTGRTDVSYAQALNWISRKGYSEAQLKECLIRRVCSS